MKIKSFMLPIAGYVGYMLAFSPLTADSRTDNPEYKILNEIALQFDSSVSSGKGSNWHNYTEIYAQYLAPYKDKPIKFLEIGIFQGNGVKLWEAYLKKAELHFVDISFDRITYFSERSHYHLANQESPEDLQQLVKDTGGNFDIIIDDGGHTMTQQLVSFRELFPHLKSEGLYIIEDLHTSYWKSYDGNGSPSKPKAGSGTFVQFLKDLIDDVNFVGARTQSANHRSIRGDIEAEMSEYRKDIYSMHFYDSMCIIIKR